MYYMFYTIILIMYYLLYKHLAPAKLKSFAGANHVKYSKKYILFY